MTYVFEVWGRINTRSGTMQIVQVGIYSLFGFHKSLVSNSKLAVFQGRGFHATFVSFFFFMLLFLACRQRLSATEIHKWFFLFDVNVKSVSSWACIFCKISCTGMCILVWNEFRKMSLAPKQLHYVLDALGGELGCRLISLCHFQVRMEICGHECSERPGPINRGSYFFSPMLSGLQPFIHTEMYPLKVTQKSQRWKVRKTGKNVCFA